MSALLYNLRKSFINVLNGLIKKPAALIAYIVIAAFFISIFLLSGLNGEAPKNHIELDIVKTIFVAYAVFLVIITLVSSLASGASFFRLADVNFLFSAPIKAGNILIYGFFKQLGVNLMVLFFLSLQYPNWKRMFGFNDGAGYILIFAYVLMLIVTSLLGMVFYSFVSRKAERRIAAKRLIYVGCLIFFLPIVLNTLSTGDLLKSTISYFSSDYIRYIPLVGWYREVLLGAFTGITGVFIFNSLLILASSFLLFLYLYRMDTDFFEDVLSNTELKESMISAAREGKTGAVYYNSRRYKRIKFNFTMEGSKAIFQRHILEQRKAGIGFISIRTFVLLACAIIAALTVKIDSSLLMSIFLGTAVYIMLIFTLAGTWAGELSRHYIYLIPASPFSKMIYSTIPEVMKIFIEGVIIFGVTGVMTKCSLMTIISVTAAYTTMGSVFTYSDLFIRRMFGKIHGKVIRMFFRMLLIIFILLPVVISSIVIITITKNPVLAFFVVSLINLAVTLIFMLIGVGLFQNPEFE